METVKALWNRWKFLLPWSVILNRIATAPVLMWEARDGHPGIIFLLAFSGAFFGDVFDGIIARFLKVSNSALRQGDSFADACLYLAVAWSAWRTYPEIILQFSAPLLTLLGFQLTWMALNLIKYQATCVLSHLFRKSLGSHDLSRRDDTFYHASGRLDPVADDFGRHSPHCGGDADDTDSPEMEIRCSERLSRPEAP